MDNREAALELYLKDWSMPRIAQALGVAEKTIKRWKKQDEWEQKKLQQAVLMKENTNGIWKIINYQNKAINALIDKYEKAAENGDGYELLGKGDLDALQKLHSIVKKKDTDIVNVIMTITELVEFIQSKDYKLAQELTNYTTQFIEHNRTKK